MFHGILYGNLDQHGREIDRVRVKGRIDIPCQMEVRPQRLRLQVQIRTHEPQLLPQRNTELFRDLQATPQQLHQPGKLRAAEASLLFRADFPVQNVEYKMRGYTVADTLHLQLRHLIDMA